MFDGIAGMQLPPTPPSSSSSSSSSSTHEGDAFRDGLPTSLPPTPPSTPSRSTSSRSHSSTPPTPLPSLREVEAENEEEKVSEQRSLSAPPASSSAASSTPPALFTEAEQRALLAVEQYQRRVRGTLLTNALDDSATHVSAALKEMMEDHRVGIAQLQDESETLRRQLLEATGLIEQLSDRLASVKQLETAWSGHAGQRSGESASPREQESAEPSGDTRAATGDAHAHDGVVQVASPSAVAALLADYHKAHATVAVLTAEQRQWQSTVADLTQMLTTITEENARYRQELARLKTTTVSITQFQAMVQAKDAAVYELEALRLQSTRLAEQLDLEAQLRALADKERDAAGAVAVDADGRAVVAPQPPASEATNAEAQGGREEEEEAGGHLHDQPPHAGMWALALREVEEQAALAATHATTRDRLQQVEAQVKHLSAENAGLTAALAALQEEDALLRQDAQGLTYRNGVLSQQLASLLVKCERLRRSLKSRPGPASAEARDDAEPRGGNPPSRARQRPTQSASHASVWQSDAIRVASLASELQQSRSRSTSALAPSRLLGSIRGTPHHRHSSHPHGLLSGFSHHSTRSGSASDAGGRVGTGADATLPPMAPDRSSSLSLLSRGTLNIALQPPRRGLRQEEQGGTRLPTVEVEQGVGRRVSTFASRRRSVALRQFGCGQAEVELLCEPRLPASDQLSGVPLGRPSPYAVLDPARGTVRRHSSDAELTLVQSSSASASASASSRFLLRSTAGAAEHDGKEAHASTLISEVGEDENQSFLDMLDMVEADDKLDRFSVNSVAELVVRNQELVQQLYSTTQERERAETALKAARLTMQRRRGSAADAASHGIEGKSFVVSGGVDDADDDGLVRSPASSEAGHPSDDVTARILGDGGNPSRKRSRGEGTDKARATAVLASGGAVVDPSASPSSGAFTTRISGTNTPPHPPPSRGGAAGFPAFPSESDIVVASQNTQEAADILSRLSQQTAAEGERFRHAPWANVVEAPQVLAHAVQDTVKQLIGAVLEQHETTVTRLDEGLSASLLQLLETKAISAAGTPQQRRATALSDASNTLLESLVSLCTSQAVALAQQAVAAAATAKEQQADVHKHGWARAQQLLRQTTEELKEALLRGAGDGGGANAPSAQAKEAEKARGPLGLVTSCDAAHGDVDRHGDLMDDPVDLTHMMALLQTAADKESTVQRVHTLAQARQQGFLAKKERKLAKLAARTERAAAALAAMLAQQHRTNLARPSASPMLTPMEAVDAAHSNRGGSPAPATLTSSASPLPPAMTLGSPTLASPLQAVAAGGGVVGGGSGVSAASIDPLLLPGIRREGSGAVISRNPYLVVTDDSDEDDADDDAMFADLKNHLALAQAQSDRLAQELHEEKATHMELYERMWKLELERDDAFKEREQMATAMQDMLTREEYERVIADLDEAKAGNADLEAQLSHAQGENSKLVTQIDLLQEQLSSHQQRHEHANAAKNDEIARQGRELEEQNRRYSRLYAKNKQLEESIDQLGRDAQVNAAAAADDAQTIADLKNQLAQVKEQFLSQESTQATLRALYPGDTVLAAHAKLVTDMRADKAAREARLHEALLRVREAENALAGKSAELRRAVQERQDAEVRLQELRLRHAGAASSPTPHRRAQHLAHTTAEGGEDRRGAAEHHDDGREEHADARSDELQAVGGGADGDDEGGETSGACLDLAGSARRQHLRRVAELQATVESQEREIALLRGAELAWKAREADLRRQLDLLGRDPISETARRYGLSTCESFEAQVSELAQINEALQDSVDSLTQEKAVLDSQLVHLQDTLAEKEQQAEDLQAALDSAGAQLTKTEASLQSSTETVASLQTQNAAGASELARLQRELESQQSAMDSLQRRLADGEAKLHQCRADREKFFNDNRALIGRIQDLQRDLTRSDEEKRAANAALSQGMLTSVAHSGGGGGTRGSSTARRHLRNASVFAASTPSPSHSTSLTGDLSTTPTGSLR